MGTPMGSPTNQGGNIMKSTLAIMVAALMLSGCMAVTHSTTPEQVRQKITESYDEFARTKEVRGPQFNIYFPYDYCLMRSWQSGTEWKHQLYVSTSNRSWLFYHSAIWRDGTEAEFVKIDSDVDSVGSTVLTGETFGITIPDSVLKRHARANVPMVLRVYGQRGNLDIQLPASYVLGYCQHIHGFDF